MAARSAPRNAPAASWICSKVGGGFGDTASLVLTFDPARRSPGGSRRCHVPDARFPGCLCGALPLKANPGPVVPGRADLHVRLSGAPPGIDRQRGALNPARDPTPSIATAPPPRSLHLIGDSAVKRAPPTSNRFRFRQQVAGLSIASDRWPRPATPFSSRTCLSSTPLPFDNQQNHLILLALVGREC